MRDIKSNTLQIIGVKQEGNVPRQAHAPQGTREPATGQPTVSRSIEPALKINWESLPPNGAGYHLNTWEFILKTVQFNSVLPSKRHLTWDRSDRRPKLIQSGGVGGCDISR